MKLCIFLALFLYNFNFAVSQQQIPLDASGMFNERGFYKSNSSSSDENEIINNFNGNLNYAFPLFRMKGPGDIFLDLSLNYNGSVNYQVVAATINHASMNSLPRYNLSAPGWILSLNGMAVQMLNFETNFFTHPYINDTVKNDKIRLLATGYHLTDNLKIPSSSGEDVICLMRGDGSVVYLRRISDNVSCAGETLQNCFIGDYYAEGLGEYARAKVEFINRAVQQPNRACGKT
jgi:hypothetical protein